MKTCKLKSAFTLVELLICLAIVGVVLTAVAIALDACVANYEANKNMSDSVIKANQALSRITADLRCAIAVEQTEPNNQCTMFMATGDNIKYLFSGGKLYLVKSGNSYKLCENISSANFDRTVGVNSLGEQCIKSVQITLRVGSGNYAWDACAAVVIRRNL